MERWEIFRCPVCGHVSNGPGRCRNAFFEECQEAFRQRGHFEKGSEGMLLPVTVVPIDAIIAGETP